MTYEDIVNAAVEKARPDKPQGFHLGEARGTNSARSVTGFSAFDTFARPASDSAREAMGQFARNMYRGEQLRYLEKNPDESPSEFRSRPGKTYLNLTRLVTDVLSLLYVEPPTREVAGAAAANARFSRIWQSNHMDALMMAADRITTLVGTVGVLATLQSDGLRYRLVPGERLRVVCDDDSTRPVAVVERQESDSNTRATVWTARERFNVVEGRVTGRRRHRVPVLPWVFLRDRFEPDTFWVRGRGVDVAFGNATLNQKLSDLAYTVKMQGFGVLEVTNAEPDERLLIGPGRAIRFQVSDTTPYGIDFKSPNAPIRELIDDLKFYLDRLLESMRVPKSAVSVELTGAVSGVSIVASQMALVEQRRERSHLFRTYEQQLFDLSARLLAAEEPLGADVDALELVLDYPAPARPMSEQETLERERFDLEHGLASPWEIAWRRNPDGYASLAEAKAEWDARARQMATSHSVVGLESAATPA